MEELVKQFNETVETFKAEAAKALAGNKAAAKRARKISLTLEKMAKEFRKLSNEAAKS